MSVARRAHRGANWITGKKISFKRTCKPLDVDKAVVCAVASAEKRNLAEHRHLQRKAPTRVLVAGWRLLSRKCGRASDKIPPSDFILAGTHLLLRIQRNNYNSRSIRLRVQDRFYTPISKGYYLPAKPFVRSFMLIHRNTSTRLNPPPTGFLRRARGLILVAI